MIYGCDICHAVDIWACHMSCLGFKKNQEADMKKIRVIRMIYFYTYFFMSDSAWHMSFNMSVEWHKNDNICQAIWHIRVFYVMSFSKKRVLLLNDWHIWPEYVRWMILKPMTYVKQYDIFVYVMSLTIDIYASNMSDQWHIIKNNCHTIWHIRV